MSKIAVIDGDVIRYSCGFASDAAAKRVGDTHEPLSYCLHGINEMIASIERDAGCSDSVIVLSHEVNHRATVYPDYKKNRDPTHRPFWYKEIKEFLIDKKGAIISDEGDEADDELGILHHEIGTDKSVICTIDKDLDQVPGWHYNWSKKRREDGVYYVSKDEGDFLFYQQVLSGDSTDNIPGLFKYKGVKATEKLKAPMLDMSPKDMYNYVVKQYDGDTDFVNTIAHLIFIKRERGVIWLPPS